MWMRLCYTLYNIVPTEYMKYMFYAILFQNLDTLKIFEELQGV